VSRVMAALTVLASMLVHVMLHGSAAAATKRQKSAAADPATVAAQTPMTFANACTAGERIVIASVGDLLFHESLQRQSLAPRSSYRRFFPAVESVLQGADITYGNLEGPAARAVAAGGGNAKDPGRIVDNKVYGTTKGALIFNYHPSVAEDLKATGFKVLSTANNHAADRGALGIDRTIDALEAAGLAHAGTRRRGPTRGELAGSWLARTEAKGIRVGWLACTYDTNGMPDRQNQVLHCYRDRAIVMREIADAAADPSLDAVILTPHWGLEGSTTPQPSDRAYARDAIEAGASAVIGAHPHVVQPWERIEASDGRDGLVVYSTGNFISNQPGADQRSGIIALLELVKPTFGRAHVSAAGFVPTWVEKNGDSAHRVVEQTAARRDMSAALQRTLKLLPAANRVAASTYRSLPRQCPPAAPEQAPIAPLMISQLPPLALPIVAPAIDGPVVMGTIEWVPLVLATTAPALLGPTPTVAIASEAVARPITTKLPKIPVFAIANEPPSAAIPPIRSLPAEPPPPAPPAERPALMYVAIDRVSRRQPCEPFIDSDKRQSKAPAVAERPTKSTHLPAAIYATQSQMAPPPTVAMKVANASRKHKARRRRGKHRGGRKRRK
jgi:Bacterial capsule synthesis protein PGA_cap